MVSKFQAKVKKHLQQSGYTVLNVVRLSDSGYPDLIGLKGGVTIFVEVKENKDTLKPLQKHRIDNLISIGFKACCIHNLKGIIYGTKIKELCNLQK